ncbi:hypothetical protein [Haloprofundus salilacus]|uniref:hypothetical protein n=1 Tax=Haloprofundus salilacus TaxID=2876190 RepID=UPI001CCA9977|nr:hypothetical protein [Haloprofundus salilacus]
MEKFLRVVFGLNVVFLVLLGVSFLGIERGSGSFVVAILSVGVITVTLLLTGTLIYIDWDGYRKYPDPLNKKKYEAADDQETS